MAALAALLIGVFGGPSEDADETPGSPSDPAGDGTVRLEIGGDAPTDAPVEGDGEVSPPPRRDPPRRDDRPPPVEPERHLVREGETLRGLAREYYGDPERWTEIQRANGIRGTVIQAGQTLIIPR